MAYTTNKFCWHGLNTTDVEKAAAFYTEVFGWKLDKMKMGDDDGLMFVANGVPHAHYMKVPMEGMPSHWANYLRVDDVDASTKAAIENGSSQLVPPNDIPPGRFSVVTTPSGAAISLFHEADESTAKHHPGGGAHWTELHSRDIDKDLEWLRKTFGFETAEMPMPGDMKYYLLNVGDDQRGGAMQSQMPEGVPALWMTWFEVDDIEAARTRLTNNGGQAFSDIMDMDGVGRMFPAADPTGAAFGVIQPAKKG